MDKRRSSMIKVMALALCLLLMLSACSNGGSSSNNSENENSNTAENNNGDSGEIKLKPVELTWYFPQPAIQADTAKIEEEINKITQEEINATVRLNPVAFGDYNQKLNTIVAAGEEFDIVWTSNWLFNYVQNQGKGAFVSLDKLIDEYATPLKESLPQFVWDATRIGGEIYAVPNYQTVTNKEGFIIDNRVIDQLGLDVSSIKTIKDIEPVLEKVKAQMPDMVPFVMDRKGRFGNMFHTIGLEGIASIAAIDLNNPDKVISSVDSPQYLDYLNMAREWYLKGWINQDAPTSKDANALLNTGKVAVDFHNVLKPGGEAEGKVQHGGNEVTYVPTSEVFAGTNTIITTMNAISQTSKNPERAMMFINLMNTNKDLYNIIAYGIEGTHYTKNDDGSIKIIQDSGYVPNADWVFGNVFNGLLLEGKDPEVAKITMQENESAQPSPIMGFKFVTDPVSAEIANVQAVLDEYEPGLNTGAVDPKEKLAEFKDKLNKAGAQKIIEEVQKQLDEWKKTK